MRSSRAGGRKPDRLSGARRPGRGRDETKTGHLPARTGTRRRNGWACILLIGLIGPAIAHAGRLRSRNLYREVRVPICGRVENDADAASRAGCAGPSQIIQKSSESLLTVRRGADYIRLTNEGGAPLATKKFASKSALREIQESRVSDTRTAPKPKA